MGQDDQDSAGFGPLHIQGPKATNAALLPVILLGQLAPQAHAEVLETGPDVPSDVDCSDPRWPGRQGPHRGHHELSEGERSTPQGDRLGLQ